MTIKEWTQLAFALSNGLSFALTIRPSWRAKVAGSLVLCIAHPGVAVYFALTGQPIFLLGNAIMTGAGIYGIVRGLRLRRAERLLAEPWESTWHVPVADVTTGEDERGVWVTGALRDPH